MFHIECRRDEKVFLLTKQPTTNNKQQTTNQPTTKK
jgi:hypothetical protein